MATAQKEIPDELLERLGQKVRALRAGRGMTRKMLAADSAVSERYLAQLEQGQGNISIALLQRVALALRTDLAALVQGGKAVSAEQVLINELVQRLDTDDQHRALQLLYQNFSPSMDCERIALVGMRGAGKTALGSRLAEQLDVPFVQLVTEIEKLGGMPVAEILSLSGQDGYRSLEEKALFDVLARMEKCVIETGGSIVSETRLLNTLLTSCYVIWIKLLLCHRSPDLHASVPPTVRPSMRNVGCPTPTGTLWPSLPQTPMPASSLRSFPTIETRVITSGPLPIRVAPFTGRVTLPFSTR